MIDIQALPDEHLIKAVLRGHQDAFSQLVVRYEKTVFAICASRLSDYQEAENAAQETFLSAYRGLSLYQGGSFKGWLCRITINKCNDFYRKKKNVELVDIEETELESQEPSPEEMTMSTMEHEALVLLLLELPEKYRVAVQGYYLEQKTVKELAQQEKINPKTMETRLYRGLKILKDRKGELQGCAIQKRG